MLRARSSTEKHGILWKSEFFTDNAQFHGKCHGREIVNRLVPMYNHYILLQCEMLISQEYQPASVLMLTRTWQPVCKETCSSNSQKFTLGTPSNT